MHLSYAISLSIEHSVPGNSPGIPKPHSTGSQGLRSSWVVALAIKSEVHQKAARLVSVLLPCWARSRGPARPSGFHWVMTRSNAQPRAGSMGSPPRPARAQVLGSFPSIFAPLLLGFSEFFCVLLLPVLSRRVELAKRSFATT